MRRDTEANWTTNHPTLAEGEMGLELDTNRWKIGNGTDEWDALPYSNQIFSGPSTIADSSSGTALKITQTGSGNSFLVEDGSSVDDTPFVINNIGYVGIQKTVPDVPLDVAGAANFSGQITSTVVTGSAPFVVASTTKVINLNADLLDGESGSYYNNSGNLTGTIPSTVLGNSSLYIGTSSIALNRSSASQTLNGVSIDGNAGTVTNGVVTTGSYSNPSWITGLAWSKISTTPTTLSGYGITDSVTKAYVDSVTVNNQTSSYILALTDAGKVIEMDVTSPNTVTIPLDSTTAFPIGTTIDIIQIGSETTSLALEDPSIVLQSSGGKIDLNGQFAAASLYKRDTNTWIVMGDLV